MYNIAKERNMETILEDSKFYLEKYHQLDKRITGQYFLRHDNEIAVKDALRVLVSDINAFIKASSEFIKTANYTTAWLENRDHEYMNDIEVDSPLLREFYSNGITIEQIAREYEAMTNGVRQERKQDNRFHYNPEERVLYRNETELTFRSQYSKKTALTEIVFEKAPESVPAIDIQERWEDKNECEDTSDDPYEWVRQACNELNRQTKKHFGIDYDLFLKESERIRLNSLAG